MEEELKETSTCACRALNFLSSITDVEGIMTVINYDFPNSSEDYIHRIGRTGRSNATGTAYTFFTTANQRQAKDLVAVMTEAKQDISPELHQMSSMGFGGFGGGRYGKFGGGRYGGGGGGKFGGGNRSYGGGSRGGGYGGKPAHKRF